MSVTRRAGDFARIYDLTERVIPAEVLARPAVPERDARKQLLELAARHHGIATFGDLDRLPPSGNRAVQAGGRRARRGRHAATGRGRRVDRSRRTCIAMRVCRGSIYVVPPAEPVRPCGVEPRSGQPVVRLPLPHRDLHASAEADLRVLRVADPVGRLHRRSSRPEGGPSGRRVAGAGAFTEPGVPAAPLADDLAPELHAMAGWLGLGRRDRDRREVIWPPPFGMRSVTTLDGDVGIPNRGCRPSTCHGGCGKRSAIFWLGFIVTIVTRSVWTQPVRAVHAVAGVALPVAGGRAGRQPARGAGLAPRHGDDRDPRRRVRRRSSSSSSAIGTLVGQQIADAARAIPRSTSTARSTSSTTSSTRTSMPHRSSSRSTTPNGPVQRFIRSQQGKVVDLSVTALGVFVKALSVLLFTFYLVADGPKLRRAICSRLRPDRQRRVLSGWELAIDKTGGYIYSRALLAGLSAFFHWVLFQAIGIQAPVAMALWVGLDQPVPAGGRHLHRRGASGARAVRRLTAQGADHPHLRHPLSAGRELLLRCRGSPRARWTFTRRSRSGRPSPAPPCSVQWARYSRFRLRPWRRRSSATSANDTK